MDGDLALTDARSRRLRALADVIRAEPQASQEELTDRLKDLGHAATQATVSRDLEQLGAVKVRRDGVYRYVLPEDMGTRDFSSDRLARIIREWVQAIEPAGPLVVLKTPPGSAHLVAGAIDGSPIPEVAGTVAGDDTIFIAVRDGYTTRDLIQRFQAMISGPEARYA